MQRSFTTYIKRYAGAFLLILFLLQAVPDATAQNPEEDSLTQSVEVPPPQVWEGEADENADADEESDEVKEERFIPVDDRDSLQITTRKLPADYTGELSKDNDFWYANADIKKEKPKKEEQDYNDIDYTPLMQRTWVQTLLWIIIVAGFIGALIFYLADSNVGLFRKRIVPLTAGNEEAGEIPEDIFAINYQKEIDKAVAAGNYRLAVRIMYLRLLRKLSDRQLIQYKQDKTNLDYLMELSSKTWYPVFFRLTRHFEYSWYGHFEVEAEAYHLMAKEFNEFEKQL